ncbi:MAG: nuclear transport factor 2 family protein [Actinomycetota bacterium]|nr:nuclear transport factor 2 family protein [Actinomycetota bacterium]
MSGFPSPCSPSRCRWKLARRFLAAAQAGDVEALVELLASDAALHGDGGGKAPAVARPIRGREQVARVVTGLTRQARRIGLRQRPTTVNGQPAPSTSTQTAGSSTSSRST